MKYEAFNYVMQRALCKLQGELNLSNTAMATELQVSVKTLGRLRTGSNKKISKQALHNFEILLQNAGW